MMNLKNVKKAETMVEKVMIPVTEKIWDHAIPLYKATLNDTMDMPIFKQMVIQYLMIAVAFVKDIQNSTTWTVVEKFYNFVIRGLETASALLGISKFNGLSLLQKLFPQTMIEIKKAEDLMKSLHGKIVVDPNDPENVKYESSEYEIRMEKLMERPDLKAHMDAIMEAMKEYEPILDELDAEEDEESEKDASARTLNQVYNA